MSLTELKNLVWPKGAMFVARGSDIGQWDFFSKCPRVIGGMMIPQHGDPVYFANKPIGEWFSAGGDHPIIIQRYLSNGR